MWVVHRPLRELPLAVRGQHRIVLGSEGQGHESRRIALDAQEGLAGRAIRDVDMTRPVGGGKALVPLRGRHGDHRPGVRRELVDPREPLLAAAGRRHHLPRGDAALLVADRQRPVSQEESEGGDGRARLGGDGRRLDEPRPRGIPHVVAEHLPLAGTDEEVLAASVQTQGRDLPRDLGREFLDRLLAARPTDERLLLDDALDDEVGGSNLGHRHPARIRAPRGKPPHRPLLLRVEDHGRSEGGSRNYRTLAILERDIEPHVEGYRPPVRGANEKPRLVEGDDRSDGGAIQARHRDGPRTRPPFERDELEAAGSRDRVGDLPVLVHPDGVSSGRTGAGGRGGVASGEGRGGRLEQRKDFGGDDEKDGEDARDDDDAAHNHEPRRPAVGQDAALRAGAADDKRAGRGCRPARREGVGVDGHVTGSSPALPSRSRRGSGSSRP